MVSTMSKRTAFRIPIGDWSGDGHGHFEYYVATAALPIEKVREAYFTAKKRLDTKICPENFCNNYTESAIEEDVRKLLQRAEAPIKDFDAFDCGEMAEYVVWFINQGNPLVDAKLDPMREIDMLPFYGNDAKKRHISCIGYGLMGA
jgi:hypothetical protein